MAVASHDTRACVHPLVELVRWPLLHSRSQRPRRREKLEQLLEREIGPEAKEAIVTAGQQLIEQGRQEGRQESRQRLRALLLRMLRRRFGDAVDLQVEQRVATASAEQLETWTESVPSATTLSELFVD